MIRHTEANNQEIRSMIRNGKVTYAGNSTLRVFGLLKCRSGKRMKKAHRVFFATADEACKVGYRPCGHCLRKEYNEWKYAV